jgi:NAD(P)-dependent dehydrogenase (short-subunit alcohol dehydrogenase family)
MCFFATFCSDCLRYELHGQGLDVVCIKPGAVKTDIWSRGHASSNTLLEGMPPVVIQLYGKLIGQVLIDERAHAGGFVFVCVDQVAAPPPQPKHTSCQGMQLLDQQGWCHNG